MVVNIIFESLEHSITMVAVNIMILLWVYLMVQISLWFSKVGGKDVTPQVLVSLHCLLLQANQVIILGWSVLIIKHATLHPCYYSKTD